VTTPNAGAVSIVESATNPTGSGSIDLGLLAEITAPPATTQNPLRITFTIDGADANSLIVRRDGVPVAACTGAPAAVPDPCVSARATVAGDAVLTILTSHASEWTFGPGATLTIENVVRNDAGGHATCSDFSFAINGGSPTPFEADCSNSIVVEAGTYSFTQAAVASYTTTYAGCTNINVASGGAATCMITNDDIAPPTYAFTGFVGPVDNPPVLNTIKAGQAVPVKFSLGGSLGLDVFASGYPKSQHVTCSTSAPLDAVEETVTAGASSLSYDPATGLYSYVWKTDKAWSQTCRQLIVRLADGTDHVAQFKFK
jgi:prealbumin domain-containing protein